MEEQHEPNVLLTKEELDISITQCRKCIMWSYSKGCTCTTEFPQPVKNCRTFTANTVLTTVPCSLDSKDQSAVQAESQLMLSIRRLQSMILIAFWSSNDTCGQDYDPHRCTCDHYRFCNLNDQVSKLIDHMESGGTV